MLSRGISECPQALWITNDTLVESATKGIIEAGLKVPDDLIVVSHCNFPENPRSSVETSWYGLNVRTFIDTALDIIRNHSKVDNKPCVRSIPVEYYLG
jgi:DNA-binding LacI/PurR family transcriptional regulator